MIDGICPPAMLYLAFSITQIIIDIFKELYNTAFLKFIVMLIFSFALNMLCKRGLTVISWFIVFIPFITMTIITTLLLFAFGLSPTTGNIDYTVEYPNSEKNVVVVNQPSNNVDEIPTADEVNSYNYTM